VTRFLRGPRDRRAESLEEGAGLEAGVRAVIAEAAIELVEDLAIASRDPAA